MLNKLKHWLFTFNLTFLLVLNLFFIIALVLALVACAVWLASGFGLLDWTQLLRPAAVSIVIYALSILIGISVVVMIQKVILNPVRGMVSAMQRLAGGDFSVRMTCQGWMRPLELREFTDAFNTAATELGSTEILRKDFINNFSHEFKTPITSLGGFADLLLEDEEMPAGERREYLSIISSESKRLAALANSVLALSRVEAQTILTDAAPFPLAEQLRQSALVTQQKWSRKKSVALTVDIPEGDECVYTGSETLLKEVWVNLFDNAIKFSPDGGAVTLTMQRTPGGVTVTVTDQGPGMDAATQARIFDQFYQGDTSHKTEGNGLGLAMVKKIVALHKGHITVDSHPGQGSSFVVWLPSSVSC
ncbi:MAG TPA: HAMP domain-containing histidine kinase [Candidatus Gemmiger faecigallinarum]|nr:HAMP domain-containing histidine kinase [bacterium]HJD20345.1 HAMP domain-containing histidine kinase [Candidatus Gemmiger faecigallinarum]